MKQLVLAAAKAGLGDDYLRLRAQIFGWRDVWEARVKNIGYRLHDTAPFDVARDRLDQIKRRNRETLRSFTGWNDRAVFARSVCDYGISKDKQHLLDADMGDETTLSDIVTYHVSGLNAPRRYLEIGVSVGKNFMQVVAATSEGDFTGFDIEDVYPLITRNLKHMAREEWPALDPEVQRRASGASFARSSPSFLDLFDDRSGKRKVRYIAGNVFDEECWRVLGRMKYNLIFSDALHTGAAIKHEYSMMKKYDLFGSDGCTIIWDDLHFPGMRDAFLEITDDLFNRFGAERCSRSLHLAYGWFGRREGYRHLVGIFRQRP